MSTLNHLMNIKLFDNDAISGNSTSTAINLNGFSLYAIQHIFSGGTGTSQIIIEVSNNGTNFDPIDYYTMSGSSGSHTVNVEIAGYSYVRVRVAYGSGGATLTSIINAKVRG